MLIARMELYKVVECDFDGKELWSFPAVTPWSVTPLSNGNVLIADRQGVREVTRRGDSVSSFSPSDVSGYLFTSLQPEWRQPNGI
jgi:hypothetical protein